MAGLAFIVRFPARGEGEPACIRQSIGAPALIYPAVVVPEDSIRLSRIIEADAAQVCPGKTSSLAYGQY